MITSTQNPQVKHLVQLQRSAKARREADVYLVEGHRMISEVPGSQLKKIYASESYFLKKQGSLPHCDEFCKAHGFPPGTLELVSDQVFKKISDTETPEGILAVVAQIHINIEETVSKLPEAPLILALESIQNPGNLGTLIRSAEASGADLILLSDDCADLYNPKTIRGSMGAVLRMTCIRTDDLTGMLKTLPVRTYAAALDGAESYDLYDYTGGTAFLIGNEGNGLRPDTIRACDARILIPMEGSVESLNAGIAGSILLYEAYRQRRNPKNQRF